MTDIYCCLTGRTPPENSIDFTEEDEEIPTGWIKVEITKKIPNPEYSNIITVMEGEVQGAIAQLKATAEEISESDLAEVTSVLGIQAKAKFAPLLSMTPRYLYEEHDAYISNSEVAEAVSKREEILKVLDIKLD